MLPTDFRCFYVDKDANGTVRAAITRRPITDLPAGDVLMRVQYSSLNFKDSLATQGHPGVVRRFPHIPGIDAAGIVAESNDGRFQPGDEIFVTGHDFGSAAWGGWAEYARVPAGWVLKPPVGLGLRDMMALGTAGFTAAQCVMSLRHHGVSKDAGEVVVTGATGGVGILAVKLLSQLGYRVAAATGKADAAPTLLACGATRVVDRNELNNTSRKPLLASKWAGAVDTVGGNTLGTVLREMAYRGCVAACGMVGGIELPTTVYPFILRGVTLDGIDSAQCPDAERRRIWEALAGDWKLRDLNAITTTTKLNQVAESVERISKSAVLGRVVVEID